MTATPLPIDTFPEKRRAKKRSFWARTRPVRSPYVIAWILFLMVFPYYFFPKGTPQFHDFLLALVMPTLMLRPKLRLSPRMKRCARALSFFLVYVTIVNVVWTILLLGEPLQSKTGSLIIPVYYLFNFMVFVYFGLLYSRFGKTILYVTTYATFASVLLLCITSLPIVKIGYRNHLFFENPNQLGYFTLLYTCIFAVGTRVGKIAFPVQMAHFVLTTYLCALSLSKAAMASTLVMMAMTFIRRPIALIGLMVAFLGVFAVSEVDDIMSESIASRLSTTGESGDDSAEGRGYDRIWKHPEHLILGAGEGENWRWDSFIRGELHSSLGTIIFSYGIPGLMTFFFFIYTWSRSSGFESTMLLLPLFLYSITHMGLRFTPFWILFALAVCIREEKHRESVIESLEGQPEALAAYLAKITGKKVRRKVVPSGPPS